MSNSCTHQHEHSFKAELLHHLPYAIISVAFSMIILSLLDYTTTGKAVSVVARKSSCKSFHVLFHSFHFMHILFAATGAILTYFKYSKNLIKGLIVCTIFPAFFCILSDVFLPYLSGVILGVDMELHICFYKELHNILPFLFIGVANGVLLRYQHSELIDMYCTASHFLHILISSLASLFYMISHGFENWYPDMGYIFFFLIIAIVIPCTLSDVVVPMYFAKE